PRQYPAPVPTGRWSARSVRRVITNPRYTGRQIWARTVAGRPAPIEQWVTSGPNVHEPLVDLRIFYQAQPRPHGPSPDSADLTHAAPQAARRMSTNPNDTRGGN